MQCINCRSGFKIYPEREGFCGFCGSRLLSANIQPVDPQYFLYIDESQDYELEFDIFNTGLVNINIDRPVYLIGKN